MAPVYFLIPGDLSLPTGGYAYDRRVLALGGQAQLDLRYMKIAGSFPLPSADDLAETAALVAGTPDHSILLIDGLALGAMAPDFVRGLNRKIAALVHHPLGLESGLAAERAAFLLVNEKAVLGVCDAVIVTSHETARILHDDFSVLPEIITVAEPGNDVVPRATGSGGQVPHIIAVGSVSPRKGYDVLIAASAELAHLPWQLTIAGAVDRGGETFAQLQRQARDCGLTSRITFTGPLSDDAIAALYQHADLFVMTSHYEGYGMALTEARAHGLPIVTTLSGAAAIQAPDAGAIKVPVNDPGALKIAIARVIGDPELRQRMADAAWAVAQSLPRWDQTVAAIAAALKPMGDA